MQREDWRPIFEEVEREVHGLIVEQQGQVEKAFALMGAGEEVDAGQPEDFDDLPEIDDHPGFADAARSCATCRNNNGGGGNCHDDGHECGPTLQFYEPRPLPATDDKFGHRRGPCNVGSRQHSDSPFYCGDGMEYVDVENRLARVKEFDPEQLRAVIALPGCQKSVVKAAAARLKKLEKDGAAL